MSQSIADIFKRFGSAVSLNHPGGLEVTSPQDGGLIAALAQDNAKTIDEKIQRACKAQALWHALTRVQRAEKIASYAAALKTHRDALAELIQLEGGKVPKESSGEAEGSADILLKTIQDATLNELNGMLRCKERPPAGVVGLITSFNFPIAVAHWTLGPALLAGNGVVWKPSEKTPLVALACKAIFDKAFHPYEDLLDIVVGGRDIGEALVASEYIDMISATGSVAMGKGIKATLAKKKNNDVPPILELGGNNGVIISKHVFAEHLQWSVKALMASFLGTTGQRCTNTRRLIVHKEQLNAVLGALETHILAFLSAAVAAEGVNLTNDYGYSALIDAEAFAHFEQAKKQVVEEGGKLWFGKRLFADTHPNAYIVEPAVALLPVQRSQTFGEQSIMYKETFAPIIFVVAYEGDIDEAIALCNAPGNSGLVGGIYTQSKAEAERFALLCEAGHCLINSPKGTGTPAYGMGFGGNKDSGEGEILNSADPLQVFCRRGAFSRIAQNKEIPLS